MAPPEAPVCRLVRLARERHQRDLETGHERGLWFDEEAANRFIEYTENYCRHSKGEWGGQLIKWHESQKQDVLMPVFGWMRLPEGMTPGYAKRLSLRRRFEEGVHRRFREVYEEVPRKNGKTTKLACVGTYMVSADFEPGAEVLAAATKRDQAKICWNEARRMIIKSPELQLFLVHNETGIYYPRGEGRFIPLGANVNSLDGLNGSCILGDEVMRWKTQHLYDVLADSTDARRQPLTWMITTAGDDTETFCYKRHVLAVQILEGVIENDSIFVYISCADEGDDWEDEETWRKANPLYGVTIKPERVREKYELAKANPEANLNAFLRDRLNIWVHQESRFIVMEDWDACADPTLTLDEFRGRPCLIGIDLSRTVDLTAATIIAPPTEQGGDYLVWEEFWMPDAQIVARGKRDGVDYASWVKNGWMTATPGRVVDYDYMMQWIQKLGGKGPDGKRLLDIREIPYDPHNASQFTVWLAKKGFELVLVRQGPLSLSPPTKKVQELTMSKRIRHRGNPVMRWNVNNVQVKRDENNNVRPMKANKSSVLKIDGFAALVTGMSRAMVFEDKLKSPYRKRGIRTI